MSDVSNDRWHTFVYGIWVSTGLKIRLKQQYKGEKWKINVCQVFFVFSKGKSDTQRQHFPEGPRVQPYVFGNGRAIGMG